MEVEAGVLMMPLPVTALEVREERAERPRVATDAVEEEGEPPPPPPLLLPPPPVYPVAARALVTVDRVVARSEEERVATLAAVEVAEEVAEVLAVPPPAALEAARESLAPCAALARREAEALAVRKDARGSAPLAPAAVASVVAVDR